MINVKHSLSLSMFGVYLVISLSGCVSVTNAPQPVPVIASIEAITFRNGAPTLTLNGDNFDSEATVEIFDSSGNFMASSRIEKSRNGNQITILKKDISPGIYTAKVKNKDGSYSKEMTFTIPEPSQKPSPEPSQKPSPKPSQKPSPEPSQKPSPKPSQKIPPPVTPVKECSGNFSIKPRVVYLGGGIAVNLFDGYLARLGTNIEGISYHRFWIKFYTKKAEEAKEADKLTLVTVALDGGGGLEAVFVDSREDFIKKIKKKMKDRTAEFSATLIDDAKKENADYYQCKEKGEIK